MASLMRHERKRVANSDGVRVGINVRVRGGLSQAAGYAMLTMMSERRSWDEEMQVQERRPTWFINGIKDENN